MDISIVTTLYRSESHVREFLNRTCAAAARITDDYEVVFVNDGSPDHSLDVALELRERCRKLEVVDLSRNYGHHKAMMTGLRYAKGDLVFLIDCDLEEEPELLETFYTEMSRTGADVVYGVQRNRKGGFFERVSGSLFFSLFNHLADYPVPRNLVHARLMSRRYVDSLLEHRDQEVYVPGLMAMTGFEQIPLWVDKHDRGDSSYTLRRRVALMTNAITSFSTKPLLFPIYTGGAILAASICAALGLILASLFMDGMLEGWVWLALSVWLVGGLTLFCLGVIGIYLSKVLIETKRRPYTVVRQLYEPTEGLK